MSTCMPQKPLAYTYYNLHYCLYILSVHSACPCSLVVPAGHALHEEEPGLSWYLPAGHGIQSACPLSFAYVPGGHNSHSTCPALEVCCPAGQSEHLFYNRRLPVIHGKRVSWNVTCLLERLVCNGSSRVLLHL